MASAQIPPPPPPESHAQGEGDPNPPTQQSFVNISSSNLSIGFINCVGQSKFNLRKQLEIQNYVKSQHLDIVHLQEVKIDSDCFSECPFIRSNFNIFSNNLSRTGSLTFETYCSHSLLNPIFQILMGFLD